MSGENCGCGQAGCQAWSLAREADRLAARIAELEAGICECLGEYDTSAKDYVYRAACRDKLRKLIQR